MTPEVRQARNRVEKAKKELERRTKEINHMEGKGTGKPPKYPIRVTVPNASQFTHGLVKIHIQNRVKELQKQVNLEKQIVQALERINILHGKVNRAQKEINALMK
jgi:hypothetical protein